jgi:transposase
MKTKYNITIKHSIKARQLMTTNNNPKAQMRLLVIALRGEGETQESIAKITKFSTRQISRIAAKFIQEGFNGLTKKKHNGNHRITTPQEEQKFFKKFKKQAQEGTLITAEVMWIEFKKEFKSTITIHAFYRMLKRNGWRKVADAQTQRASKKLNLDTEHQEKRFIWVVDEEKSD